MNEFYHPVIREVAWEVAPDPSVIDLIDPEGDHRGVSSDSAIPSDSCAICVRGLAGNIVSADDERLSELSKMDIQRELPEVLRGHGGV